MVDSVTFPDATGRKTPEHATPVVDVEGWLQILALLPEAAGKRYLKATAELVVRVWSGDTELGSAIRI